jgi:hypothetical protein
MCHFRARVTQPVSGIEPSDIAMTALWSVEAFLIRTAPMALVPAKPAVYQLAIQDSHQKGPPACETRFVSHHTHS